jgi:hypothetical protein
VLNVIRREIYVTNEKLTEKEFLSREFDLETKKSNDLVSDCLNEIRLYGNCLIATPNILSIIDQISYFTRETLPAFKSYPDQLFFKNFEKFKGLKTPKIFHAPSSPILKGTQLVRAAITRLKKENYKFEYKEAQFLQNSLILEELKSTHIVLDQFYSCTIGVSPLDVALLIILSNSYLA